MDGRAGPKGPGYRIALVVPDLKVRATDIALVVPDLKVRATDIALVPGSYALSDGKEGVRGVRSVRLAAHERHLAFA